MSSKVKVPRTKSALEAAYCAAWNARYASTDRFECMEYCTKAIELAGCLVRSEQLMINEKIGEAQKHWGLQ